MAFLSGVRTDTTRLYDCYEELCARAKRDPSKRSEHLNRARHFDSLARANDAVASVLDQLKPVAAPDAVYLIKAPGGYLDASGSVVDDPLCARHFRFDQLPEGSVAVRRSVNIKP